MSGIRETIQYFDVPGQIMAGATILIIGKRASGKSSLLFDILSHIAHFFQFGLALTPTQSSRMKFASCMPSALIDRQSPERLQQFIAVVNSLYDKAITMGKEPRRSYLLCDDTAFDDKFMRCKTLSEVFLNGRNFGMTCILVLQYIMKVGPDLRGNADFVFVFWDNNSKNQEKIREFWFNMMPKKTKKRKLTIADARKILIEEESAKLIDMDEVKEEAITKAENTGIIFIDEIDKIAVGAAKKGGPDVSREGVQRDLLPIVEGSAVNTKYGVVNTDHVLFIAAGAFHFTKPSDLIPELQGRFPIRVELDDLTKDDFLRILKEPKNALTKQYQALIASEDVEISFQDEALEEIAEMAFNINAEVENIGARRLHTVMSKLLNEILFDIPDVIGPNAKIVITRDKVKERLSDMVQNKDLSHYIL